MSWPGRARRWALHAGPARELALLTHAFTHFTLDIQPLRLDVQPGDSRVVAMEGNVFPGCRWVIPADAALPAPVRRILDALAVA